MPPTSRWLNFKGKSMQINSEKLELKLSIEDKNYNLSVFNKITKKETKLSNYKEFEISYYTKKNLFTKETKVIDNSMCDVVEKDNLLIFTGRIDENTWKIIVKYEIDSISNVIRKRLEIDVDNKDLLIDYITLDSFMVGDNYNWTIPEVNDRV